MQFCRPIWLFTLGKILFKKCLKFFMKDFSFFNFNRKRGPFLSTIKPTLPKDQWANEENRSLLRAMSMTVCDLSAITKPWEIEKRVADLVSSEFFEQGDMERQELNITPIDIMNREKEDQLPMMQVGFIDSICLPIYEVKFKTL
jgi:dual 3',5'-cyclic-AMP and -GMP phosphodiesterase 11